MQTPPLAPTVLVVDDDAFFRELLAEMFASLGVAQVLQAKDGAAGLKLLKTHPQPIHLLVCDVFMPDMDGIEFLNQLMARQYTGAIVMASGVDIDMLDLARTIASANGLRLLAAMSKPVSREQLAQALDAYHAQAT